MRRIIRRGISILLSLGMACSMPVYMGSVTADAAAENASDVASVKKTAAGTGGSSYGDVHGDEATGYLYKFYDDGTGDAAQKVEIVGHVDIGIATYADTGTELVIPGTLDGKEVTSIGEEAFKGNNTITSVTISEGITTIGYSAFENCTNLEAVSIPSTITEWSEPSHDNNAFMGCTKLKELELAEGLTILGQKAFYGCTSLEKVRIPSTIETFHDKVFSDCTSLKEVELPEGIKQIGYQAFAYCALEEVTIPSTLEYWPLIHANGIMATPHDNSTFWGCDSLRKVVFTEGLKTLYNFQGTSRCPLVKEIEIPGSVEDLAYSFDNSQYLEKVTLKEGIQKIGAYAFRKCTSLKEIRFPSTIMSKESTSFTDVKSVERIVFSPLGMPGAGANLTSFFDSTKEMYILSDSETAYRDIKLAADGKVYCPQDSKTYETYQSQGNLGDRLVALPTTGAEAVGYEGDYDEQEHDAVTLSGIQEGDQVYYRLNGEKTFRTEMPKVKETGTYTVEVYVERPGVEQLMSGYSVLKVEAKVTEPATPSPSPSPSPTLGGNVTPTPTPGGNATPTPTPGGNGGQATPTPKPPVDSQLQVGSKVTAGKFKYKVTNATAGKLAVAVQAPKSKTAKSVVIPATVKVQGSTYQVTSIAANAFKNCKKLKSVTIGKNVTSIGKNAFSNAKALKKITVKTTKLKSVGKGAFKGIHKKAVIKVPKAKLKKYQKLFKGKGQKKTVKIKK